MAKLDKKCKICRREGEKLFLKGEKCYTTKCPMVKRNYPPGVHGPKGKHRLTPFGKQLREKQKAKRIYGISEKQFHNYYQKAVHKKGDSGEILIKLLETRLDNVIYKMGLSDSRTQARQMVSHGFFVINGKRIDIPSYQVKVKDIITIKPNKIKTKNFTNRLKQLEKYVFPSWINFDLKEMKGKIISEPKSEDLKQVFDTKQIVEYYSR